MAVSKATAASNLAASTTSINSNGNARQLPTVFPYVLQQGHSPGQVNKRESLAINVNVIPNEPPIVQTPQRPGANASVSVSVNNSSIVNGAGDTPEIRKYKKKFSSEVLCAALWGVNLLIGTDSGLMLLDRSGQGKGWLDTVA